MPLAMRRLTVNGQGTGFTLTAQMCPVPHGLGHQPDVGGLWHVALHIRRRRKPSVCSLLMVDTAELS